MSEASSNIFNKVQHFLGVTALAITMRAPLKRIEVILRTQHVNPQLDSSYRGFKGGIECMIRLPREQGILSYWRGNMMAIFCAGLNQIFIATIYPLVQKSRMKFDNDPGKEIYSVFLTGMLSSCLSILATFPFNIATLKLQADCGGNHAKPQFKSLPDLFDRIYTTDGLTGFYRGFGVSLLGIAVYRGAYFAIADTLVKIRRNSPSYSMQLLKNYLINTAVVALAGTISYPFMVVKERMQVQLGWDEQKFITARECIKHTLKKEGFRGLYRGYPFSIATGLLGGLIMVLSSAFMSKKNT